MGEDEPPFVQNEMVRQLAQEAPHSSPKLIGLYGKLLHTCLETVRDPHLVPVQVTEQLLIRMAPHGSG